MKITDDSKGIKIEVKTTLSKTRYEVEYFELASIIGQFMAEHDMTDERFFETFFNNSITNKE